MNAAAPQAGPDDVSRAALWLPLAYYVHLAEEWFGGFVPWTAVVFGSPIGVERFWWINGVAVVLFPLGVFAAWRSAELRFFPVSLAALFVLNGVLHALATLVFATYSPGTVTGLLVYLPLGLLVLRHARERLPHRVFVASVVAGVVVHALVTLVAVAGSG